MNRLRLLKFPSFALALCVVPLTSHAHPLQAEPINHPYVFTFDQFHLNEDPDESLVKGGLLLMAETNCIACHAAPKAWEAQLATRPGPDLSGIGSRLDADTIWLMVRSPQHRKRGTLMPGLFGGADDDAENVEALTQYLLTLQEPLQAMPAGDAARGKLLYHTTGCVACHEPATDYRPPSVAADRDVEKPGNGSYPIALADAYEATALGRFLLNPHEFRPAGRMPSMHLSEQEAADIAAYLHIGRTAEKAVEREALKIAPQSAALGKQQFIEQRCANCHRTGNDMEQRPAKPLSELKSGGCIAAQPVQGAPRFDFNLLQQRALTLALAEVQHHQPADATLQERIDWQLLRLNCYACHDRDGKGGPEDPRAQYFLAANSNTAALGEQALMPPTLDQVGWKLSPAWLHRVLHGEGGNVRSYFSVRMPNFGETNTSGLVDLLIEADRAEHSPAGATNKGTQPPNPEQGRQLMGTNGLGCVTCHGLKGSPPLKLPASDLTHTVERLNPAYFEALLLHPLETDPRIAMPALFTGRQQASAEVQHIWTYLRALDQQPLPEGMEKAGGSK